MKYVGCHQGCNGSLSASVNIQRDHSIGPSIVWNDKVEKMDNLKWGPIRWCFTFVPPTPPSGSIGPDVSVDKSLLSL